MILQQMKYFAKKLLNLTALTLIEVSVMILVGWAAILCLESRNSFLQICGILLGLLLISISFTVLATSIVYIDKIITNTPKQLEENSSTTTKDLIV